MTKISTCQQFHQVKMYNVRRSVLQCAQICRNLPKSVQINQDLIGSVWLCQNVKQIVKLSQYQKSCLLAHSLKSNIGTHFKCHTEPTGTDHRKTTAAHLPRRHMRKLPLARVLQCAWFSPSSQDLSHVHIRRIHYMWPYPSLASFTGAEKLSSVISSMVHKYLIGYCIV